MNPVFLSLEQVLAIHASQLALFGGLAGIRDMHLLQSAIAAPQAAFGGKYLHGDLVEMASAYLYHVTKNHPFFDGNKRVAAAATIIFFEANGLRFVADVDAHADLVLNVARGNADRAAIVRFLRANLQTR